MRLFLAALMLVALLAPAPTRAAEPAMFTLSDGTTRYALFIIMKDDYIFVGVPKPDGTYQSLNFRKTLVKKVEFLNGNTLNLTKSNSPPDLNDRNLYGNGRLRYKSRTISNPEYFVTFVEDIAVRPFTANGVTEYEALSLSDALRVELAKTGKYRVMEREQMKEVLREQGFQQTGACDASCVVEMGKILSVKSIVIGSVSLIGRSYAVNVRVVDVATAKILIDINELYRGTIESVMVNAMPELAARMGGIKRAKIQPGRVIALSAAGAAIVGAAVVVPAIIMNKPQKQPEPTGGVGIEW
jgi:TolB-like protein